MSDWQAWLTVLGGSGVIALLATIGKGIYGWLTGSSQRRMDRAADAIDSMATAGMWADASAARSMRRCDEPVSQP